MAKEVPMPSTTVDDPIIRPKHLPRATGLSARQIRRKVKNKTFPEPIRLGDNSIGWPDSVIKKWREECPRLH